MQDLYAILNIERSASQEDVNAAFKKMAKQYHPDVNKSPGAAEKFKEISYAYDVLSNPEKRAAYDNGSLFGGGEGKDFHDTDSYIRFNFENINFSDIFSAFGSNLFTFFGDGERAYTDIKSDVKRGSDIDLEMGVTLEEASNAVSKEVQYNALVTCDLCKGFGSMNGKSGYSRCDYCQGKGQTRNVNHTLFGEVITSNICSKCRGKGTIIQNPCSKCSGQGINKGKRKVTVTLPLGIRDSVRLKVKGKGNNGPAGGDAGNLYILVKILPHEYFVVDNNDIISLIEIPFHTAILGGKTKVKTLYGEREVNLKPMLKSGDRIRLSNYGMPIFNNGKRRGDMYLNVEIVIPATMSTAEKKLVEELSKTLVDKPKQKQIQQKRSYFSRIRSFFANQ